jgi:hypothetical protein
MPMLGIRAINYIRMHEGFTAYFTCIRMHFCCLFNLIGALTNTKEMK